MGQSAFSDSSASEEHRRAANGYLVWPLALANFVREDAATTIWSRIHARQAVVFGLLAWPAYLVFLALPLIAVVAVPTLSPSATIAVYAVSLVADVLAAIALLVLAIRNALRAARGELFSIPLVTPLAERFLPLERR